MITHFSMSQCFTHGKQKHRRLALKYLGVCKPKKSNEGDPQKDYINLPLQSFASLVYLVNHIHKLG